MNDLLAWFNPGRRLMLLALSLALAAGYAAWTHHQRDIGRAEVQLKWDASVSKQRAAALAETMTKAQESKRRIERQEENQRAQLADLALARAAADRNAADADRVRVQSAAAARDWSTRLADSPTRADLEAAAAAIAVQSDVRGRLDAAAGELAAFAWSSRTAGLKCERDYQALTPP